MTLVLEIRSSETWEELSRLEPGAPAGSFSNNTDQGRDIIHFRSLHTGALIERSIAGVDAEQGPVRMTSTVGMEQLAALLPGESYELELRTDRMPAPVPLRFRCEATL